MEKSVIRAALGRQGHKVVSHNQIDAIFVRLSTNQPPGFRQKEPVRAKPHQERLDLPGLVKLMLPESKEASQMMAMIYSVLIFKSHLGVELAFNKQYKFQVFYDPIISGKQA